MTTILVVATAIFNTLLLVFYYYIENLIQLYKNNALEHTIISPEFGKILLLIKFSTNCLLFFVSDRLFRSNLFHLLFICFKEKNFNTRF